MASSIFSSSKTTSGRATFSLGGFVNRNLDDRQWVSAVETDTPHYVFGRIDQTTVGLTARVDYAFTPTLSLQLYAQPFVSAGSYDAFKQVDDPVGDAYAHRFASVDARLEDGRYRADLNGDGVDESFRNPDFNFRQFRSNAVLRWEYRPGSSLFLVWSQGRDDAEAIENIRDAIREYLEVVDEQLQGADVREIDVAI